MNKRTSPRMELAETRDKIRALVAKTNAMTSSNSLGSRKSIQQVWTYDEAARQALSTVNNIKADLAAAQDEVARLRVELDEARAVHNRIRAQRSQARRDASPKSAELTTARRDLAELRDKRFDLVIELLKQGEAVSDIADYAGLSVPRVYQIRSTYFSQ